MKGAISEVRIQEVVNILNPTHPDLRQIALIYSDSPQHQRCRIQKHGSAYEDNDPAYRLQRCERSDSKARALLLNPRYF